MEEICFDFAVKNILLNISKLADFFRWSSGGTFDVLNTISSLNNCKRRNICFNC